MIRYLALILISATSVCEANLNTYQTNNSDGTWSRTMDSGNGMTFTTNSDGSSSRTHTVGGMTRTINSDGSHSTSYNFGSDEDDYTCDYEDD